MLVCQGNHRPLIGDITLSIEPGLIGGRVAGAAPGSLLISTMEDGPALEIMPGMLISILANQTVVPFANKVTYKTSKHFLRPVHTCKPNGYTGHTEHPISFVFAKKKNDKFCLWWTLCKPSTNDTVHVHVPVHTYAHLVHMDVPALRFHHFGKYWHLIAVLIDISFWNIDIYQYVSFLRSLPPEHIYFNLKLVTFLIIYRQTRNFFGLQVCQVCLNRF